MLEAAIEDYLKGIRNLPEFKKLLELKKIIDKKYSKEIVNFKTKEALYLEARDSRNPYSNLEEIQREFSSAKSKLYEKKEVQEYFEMERKIQQEINEDFDELKASISTKFKTENKLEL